MTQFTTRSGVPISRFAFGCMQWGGRADPDQSRATYEAAIAAGINHFDTAYVYTDGMSETLLGQFVTDPDSHFIATKAAYTGGSGRQNILEKFDISRQRLGMDRVDMLYLHRFDDDTPLEQTFETLALLQSNGTIRHIGVSNFAAWQVMKAQNVAAQFGTKIDAIQPMYNLVKRQVESEILPVCADQDIQVFSYSPLGGGLLTGKYVAPDCGGRLENDARYATRYGQDWMHDAATGLAKIADEMNVPTATLAVAWLAHHAPQVSPILSARNADQLKPSLDGMTYALAPEIVDRITALSRTPAPATDRIEEA